MWLFLAASAWIVVGNGVGCAFLLGTATLYAFILSSAYISFNMMQLEPTILRYARPFIVVCYVVIIGHGLLTLRTIRHQLQRRWLRRRVTAIRPSGPSLTSIVPARPTVPHLAAIGRHPSVLRVRVRAVLVFAWAHKRWIRYRAEITRVFMLWEVANQTYQANKMSQLVPSVWLNRLVSIVIALNCWFSPILHRVMRGRRSTHIRLARLLVDSWLDFIYNIGIPLVIFYPYYRDYIDPFLVYPAIFYYRDTWYVNAKLKLRQVFVTSWVDSVSKVTGSIALLYRLYVIENVLKEAKDPDHRSRRETNAQGHRKTHLVAIQQLEAKIRSRVTRFLDVILVLWGLVVLGLHSFSAFVAIHGNSAGCILETRPWGSASYSCIALEVSCIERKTTGRHPAIADAVGNVDSQLLRVLILSHCSELEIPPSIQNYSALSMVKIYNNTIMAWDETAALHDTTNPSLQVMYFTRVNMTEIPRGMLASDFPSSVWDIEFCVTNVTTFPDAVLDAWLHVNYLVIEASPLLSQIPDAVYKLPSVQFFMLGMNSLHAVPEWLFQERDIVWLFLDGNPLRQLPPIIKSPDQLRIVSIRHTNVGLLPASWAAVTSSEGIVLQAEGSPLCTAHNSSASIGDFHISCDPVDTSTSLLSFPLADEDAWRASSTGHSASSRT